MIASVDGTENPQFRQPGCRKTAEKPRQAITTSAEIDTIDRINLIHSIRYAAGLFKQILSFQARAAATLTVKLAESATAALEDGLGTDCYGRALLVLRGFASTIALTHLNRSADTLDAATVLF